MFNKLKNLFTNDSELVFEVSRNTDDMDFFLSHKDFAALSKGEHLDALATGQNLVLKMLAEQGEAETFPNGYTLSYGVISRLDDLTLDILGLPKKGKGKIKTDIKGRSAESQFTISLSITDKDGNFSPLYKRKGAFLSFSENQSYTLGEAEYEALTAVEKHQKSKKSESDNLVLVHTIKQCAEQSSLAEYDLSHFNNFDISVPNTITISTTLD